MASWKKRISLQLWAILNEDPGSCLSEAKRERVKKKSSGVIAFSRNGILTSNRTVSAVRIFFAEARSLAIWQSGNLAIWQRRNDFNQCTSHCDSFFEAMNHIEAERVHYHLK